MNYFQKADLSEREKKLFQDMRDLDLFEKDLQEQFTLGSGKGGQKINKTASCVQLLHQPSGLSVRCQKTRSQRHNRYWARRSLCDQLQKIRLAEKRNEKQAREKKRRQKRKRPRAVKERILKEKKKRSETKRKRAKIQSTNDW